MDAFQQAFALIAQQLQQACDVQVIWKDADPTQWDKWPRELSQHTNAVCRRIKKQRDQLAVCCQVDTAVPSRHVAHKRTCPFGVVEQVVPFVRAGRTVGWCFVGCWQSADAAVLPAYVPNKAKAAAALTRRLVESVLHLHVRLAPVNDERLLAAYAYIEEHASATLRARDVAAAVYLSTSRFVHWFKEQAGVSYSDYSKRIVMERAGQLLRMRAMTITAVAMHLNFSSAAYFSHAFKRYYGLPPARWVEQSLLRGE